MKKKSILLPVFLLAAAAAGAQTAGNRPPQTGVAQQMFPRTEINTAGQGNTQAYRNALIASEAAEPWYQFREDAKTKLSEERFAEAKEALKTAIRIAPMNQSLWALYDEAVASDYLEMKRREKLNPVIMRDIQPLFHITRVDTYIELDTMFVVGNILNTSGELRQKIVLSARLFDKNKNELKRTTGSLIIPDRGLMPNENSLFEIPFKNFPPGVKSVRVEVSAWE